MFLYIFSFNWMITRSNITDIDRKPELSGMQFRVFWFKFWTESLTHTLPFQQLSFYSSGAFVTVTPLILQRLLYLCRLPTDAFWRILFSTFIAGYHDAGEAVEKKTGALPSTRQH